MGAQWDQSLSGMGARTAHKDRHGLKISYLKLLPASHQSLRREVMCAAGRRHAEEHCLPNSESASYIHSQVKTCGFLTVET